jgi:hypothetical protein
MLLPKGIGCEAKKSTKIRFFLDCFNRVVFGAFLGKGSSKTPHEYLTHPPTTGVLGIVLGWPVYEARDPLGFGCGT